MSKYASNESKPYKYIKVFEKGGNITTYLLQ